MWAAILAAIQFIGNLFGFVQQKDAQKNAADVKAAQEQQNDANERARIEKDVAKGDDNAIRNDISES